MKRRELLTKTGYGLTGMVASRLGLASSKNGSMEGNRLEGSEKTPSGAAPDFETLRRDYPPIEQNRVYLDTAFVGLMSRQVKAAHEAYLEERFQFGPLAPDKTILGVWMGKTDQVRAKAASLLGAKEKEIAFTYCTGCGSNIALNGIDWRRGDNAVIDDLEFDRLSHLELPWRAGSRDPNCQKRKRSGISRPVRGSGRQPDPGAVRDTRQSPQRFPARSQKAS